MMRRVMVVAGLTAVAVVGLVLARSGGDASIGPVADSVPDAALGSDTDSTVAAGPSPEKAAADAVARTGEVVTAGLISRRELIESFTTVKFGGELADLTSQQVTSMQLSMSESGQARGGLSVAEFPLRARTVSHAGDSAVVEVWSVSVVASGVEAGGSAGVANRDARDGVGRWSLACGWLDVRRRPGTGRHTGGSDRPGGRGCRPFALV